MNNRIEYKGFTITVARAGIKGGYGAEAQNAETILHSGVLTGKGAKDKAVSVVKARIDKLENG
jgi:hypothetical protein